MELEYKFFRVKPGRGEQKKHPAYDVFNSSGSSWYGCIEWDSVRDKYKFRTALNVDWFLDSLADIQDAIKKVTHAS